MKRIPYLSFFLCLLTLLLLIGQCFSGEANAAAKYKLQTLKMEAISATPLSPEASLSSKKVLMVIATKDFQDQEFLQPKKILEKRGVKIDIASTSLDPATGMHGLKVKPDRLIKQVKAGDYDAIIFVGGNGALVLADDRSVLSLAREAQKNKKVIGAICIAPVILAKAGILEGKRATVSPSGAADLKKGKAFCTGKKVEVDGNLITGNGPGAAEEFGNTILRHLLP